MAAADNRAELAERNAEDAETSSRAVAELLVAELARVCQEAEMAKAELKIERAGRESTLAMTAGDNEARGRGRAAPSPTPLHSYGGADRFLEAAKEAAQRLTADADTWLQVSSEAASLRHRGGKQRKRDRHAERATPREIHRRRDGGREAQTRACRSTAVDDPFHRFSSTNARVLAHQSRTRPKHSLFVCRARRS